MRNAPGAVLSRLLFLLALAAAALAPAAGQAQPVVPAAERGGFQLAPCEQAPEEPEEPEEPGEPEEPEEPPPPPPTPLGRAVRPAVQTPAPPDDGDIDDPAIWVHPTRPGQSTVITTDKGCNRLFVYDLAGRPLQSISLGPVTDPQLGGVNNVDIRTRVRVGGRRADVVVATDQANARLALFTVDRRTRRLVDAGSFATAPLNYGACLYRSAESGKLFAFVTQEEDDDVGIEGGIVEQYELTGTPDGKLTGRKVRKLDLGGQSEGCAADDELGALYVANEEAGVFRFSAEPGGGTRRRTVDTTGPDGHLTADVEGIAIARTGRRRGHLIVSSQGNDSFAVYARSGRNRFEGHFHVRASGAIGAVNHTDGLDVTTADLGRAFPHGMFVAQDDGENLKYVPLERIFRELR
jgi:3-phytase